MKNNWHRAFRTNMNYPIHISCIESLQAYLDDEIRLIAQLPSDWPKLRKRDFDSATTKDTYTVDGHTVADIEIGVDPNRNGGVIVDGKYFISDGVLEHTPSLSGLWESFTENSLRPYCRREWSREYPSSHLPWYQVSEDLDSQSLSDGLENCYPFSLDELKTAGIDNLLDLAAKSWMFTWSDTESRWALITDEHELTKRLRKPWCSFIVQLHYGELNNTVPDIQKALNFVISKVADTLSDDEKTALQPFIDGAPTLAQLTRLGIRQQILNDIMSAYDDPSVLKAGSVVREDPLFKMSWPDLTELTDNKASGTILGED